jgi:hypothetical protein
MRGKADVVERLQSGLAWRVVRVRAARLSQALRSRLVAWAALARALMTEQTPEQRERYDQQHGHDRTATDVVHSATSYSRARSATSQYNR